MTFVEQSYSQLQLSLYNGNVDVSELQILATEKRQVTSSAFFEVGIIGASHFIKVHHHQDCLTEIFACSSIKNTALQIQCIPFNKLRQLHIKKAPTIDYQFSYEFLTINQQASINEEIAVRKTSLSPKGIFLSYHFPSISPKIQAAKTIVIADVTEDLSAIHTYTVHEYLQEEVLIINESRFEYNNV